MSIVMVRPSLRISDSTLPSSSSTAAPSGANHQPWHFVAVSDPATKSKIREAAEIEEREFYEGGRATPEWLEALLDALHPDGEPGAADDFDGPDQSEIYTLIEPLAGKDVDFAPTWSAGTFTWDVDIQTQYETWPMRATNSPSITTNPIRQSEKRG